MTNTTYALTSTGSAWHTLVDGVPMCGQRAKMNHPRTAIPTGWEAIPFTYPCTRCAAKVAKVAKVADVADVAQVAQVADVAQVAQVADVAQVAQVAKVAVPFTGSHYGPTGGAVCGSSVGWVATENGNVWTGGTGTVVTGVTCVACRDTGEFRSALASFTARADRDDLRPGGQINGWVRDYPHATIGADGDVTTVPCQCEHVAHDNTNGNVPTAHPFNGAPSGARSAMWVGPVCNTCADTCMVGYVVTGASPDTIDAMELAASVLLTFHCATN